MLDEEVYCDIDSLLPIAIVSGGFDPIHSGHIALLEHAARLGRVLVILNSDDWLCRKKGKPFMNWEERRKIIRALRAVSGVTHVNDHDETVCEALRRIKAYYTYPEPQWSPKLIFCNGGDRGLFNTPEQDICAELGIEAVFGVGGAKTQSSSALVKAYNS